MKKKKEYCEECKNRNSRTKNRFDIFRKVFAVLIIVLCAWLFIIIIIPLTLNIINIFFALTQLYSLVSLEFQFIGGMFFFIVFWYVLIALINITIYVFNVAIRTYNNETN